MSDLTPATPPPGATSSEFVNWRLAQLEHQVVQIDQQGTRGVAPLAQRVDQIAEDLHEHERQHERAADQAVKGRRWTIGIVVALVTPLYPLLIALVIRHG